MFTVLFDCRSDGVRGSLNDSGEYVKLHVGNDRVNSVHGKQTLGSRANLILRGASPRSEGGACGAKPRADGDGNVLVPRAHLNMGAPFQFLHRLIEAFMPAVLNCDCNLIPLLGLVVSVFFQKREYQIKSAALGLPPSVHQKEIQSINTEALKGNTWTDLDRRFVCKFMLSNKMELTFAF